MMDYLTYLGKAMRMMDEAIRATTLKPEVTSTIPGMIAETDPRYRTPEAVVIRRVREMLREVQDGCEDWQATAYWTIDRLQWCLEPLEAKE